MDSNQLAALLIVLAGVSFYGREHVSVFVKGLLSRVAPSKPKPPEGGDPDLPAVDDLTDEFDYCKVEAFTDLMMLRQFLEHNKEVLNVLDELVAPAIAKVEE